MKTVRAPFTLADWLRLPEGFPAQLFDGRLLREPSPTYGHQALVGRVYRRLVDLVGEDLVVIAPADVVIDRLNVLQPDVCVLRTRPDPASHDVGIPLACSEVLSPSTRRRDRTLKVTKLLAAGVEEVWLLDPALRTIEIRTIREPLRARGATRLASTVVDGFALTPADLFAGL